MTQLHWHTYHCPSDLPSILIEFQVSHCLGKMRSPVAFEWLSAPSRLDHWRESFSLYCLCFINFAHSRQPYQPRYVDSTYSYRNVPTFGAVLSIFLSKPKSVDGPAVNVLTECRFFMKPRFWPLWQVGLRIQENDRWMSTWSYSLALWWGLVYTKLFVSRWTEYSIKSFLPWRLNKLWLHILWWTSLCLPSWRQICFCVQLLYFGCYVHHICLICCLKFVE